MNSIARPIRLVRARRAPPNIFPAVAHRRRIFTAWAKPRAPPAPRQIEDRELAELVQTDLHPLSLADLVKHGRPPLSEQGLLASANFALSLIPVRLAHRIQALRSLPYIVVSNPNINRIYNNYLHSLSTLLPWFHPHKPAIQTLAEESRFTAALSELVATHADTIPILARGFLECRRYISPADVTRFLEEHLRVRIGTRLIAEQHIALHASSLPNFDRAATARQHAERPNYIGVIDTLLRPAATVELCADWVSDITELRYGVRPRVVIDGEPSASLAYVPMHLEYIITELLKNAFRASIENGTAFDEPVVVTIAPEPAAAPSSHTITTTTSATTTTASGPGGSHRPGHSAIIPLDDNAPGVTIRIRDRGGGIPPSSLDNIWSYSFTTFSDDDELPGSHSPDGLAAISSAGAGASSLAGLGYGLPLSRAYAEYFGGGIAVQSLYGWGTDVYLRLKGVGGIVP